MARRRSTDRSFLEQKGTKWRVVVAVPRDLQGKLGTKLKRSLNTDSLAVANSLKWPIVTELKAEIDRARDSSGVKPGSVMREAVEIAVHRSVITDPVEASDLDFVIAERAEQIQGPPIAGDKRHAEYDPAQEQAARRYAAVATGKATPLTLHHPKYLESSTVKPRTKADDSRALAYLLDWCAKNRIEPSVEAISRRHAVRFVDDLPKLVPGRTGVTLQKYVSRLSRYWQWLSRRSVVEVNVWADLKLPQERSGPNEEERPFTDEEVLKLLNGPATQAMHDLMRIAALTGARLEAIVDLRADGCAKGNFLFKPQKKEKGVRAVPIHPDLADIVKRRTEGKGPSDSLFPEWPPPMKSTSKRERSFKASNAFTAYRREVGVDDRVEGKRRSLVNFHSFRRWFITKAEQAGQPESIIAVVVGHKRQGMTLGRYSAGPSKEQARACVEAVRLPKLVLRDVSGESRPGHN